MDHYKPLLPDPKVPWPHEYWDQPPNDLRDSWSREWDRQSVDLRDRWQTDYWDQQPSIDPWASESWGQIPRYPRDRWSSKSRNRQSTDHRNPWFSKHRDQHPIGHKNLRPQECYQHAHETIQRPSQIQNSSVSRFQHTRRNHSAYHPYQRRDKMSSYKKNSIVSRSHSKSSGDSSQKQHAKATAGSRGNVKAVSARTVPTKPASNETPNTSPNTVNKRTSEKLNNRLQAQIGNNTASDTTSEEVHYLYSVDPNEGKLVELIDLSENSQISESQDLFAPELNSYIPVNSNFDASNLTARKDPNCGSSTFLNKEKSLTQNTSNIPSENGDAHCNMCKKNYEELHNNKCDLYIAKCGHLFCVLCIPCLKIQSKCIKCKSAISNLRKIFL